MIKTICIIGLWHLGIINAVGFAEKGYRVIGIDFDSSKIKNLNDGSPPLFEPGLEDLLKKHLKTGILTFSSNIEEVSNSDTVIIAYDSPINELDEVDISPIIEAADKISSYLKETTPVVITSQVPLGSCEKIEKQISISNPKWKSGVIYTPENLKLGTAISRFLMPDMIVLGSKKELYDIALSIYEKFYTEKINMNLRSAEMVKHALNTFLATSITFINEIANLSDKLGANAVAVGKALKLDSRIGKSALMTPGLGFSGGTLARDVIQLRKFAQENNYEAKLLDSIIYINENSFDEIINKLTNKLGTLNQNFSVGILGLTYKPNTSTLRRSSAIKILHKLNQFNIKCYGYDPMADSNEIQEYKNILIRKDTPLSLAEGRDALILITEWQEFKNLDFMQLSSVMKNPIFIDSKNFLDPDIMIKAGFDYQGFGQNITRD